MKVSRIVISIVSLLSLLGADIPLGGEWRFNIGDDARWADTDYNDSTWYSISVPGLWTEQGFANYSGVAWYRTTFPFDKNYHRGDTIYLFLGVPDDSVQVFVNGQRLHKVAAAIDTSRQPLYKISTALLANTNLLALKMDSTWGGGGLRQAPVLITEIESSVKTDLPTPKAHRSWYELPFSNGISGARYNVTRRCFTSFTPHLYSQYDHQEKTPLIVSSARTILFKNRREIDLTEMETVSAGYINGTGIVHHKLQYHNGILDQYAFSPLSSKEPFWVFFSVLSGDSLADYAFNFELTDVKPGVNVGKWSFRENNKIWLFVVCNYDRNLHPKAYGAVKKYKNEHPGFTALIKEINWWKSWQQRSVVPDNISDTEKSVYLQSLALLKMAQVRERFPARGQIVHTFPPGSMAVASVAGMGFSIDAFLKSGHYEEALAALQFIMNSTCGSFKHHSWSGENRGLGQNYAVSVNYYHGNGSEATDMGEFGPVIYLGNFGILLSNLRKYIETTGDYHFLDYYWPKISSEIADVIINNIESGGLLKADNGFYNQGAPKHYFFTSSAAYRGLVDAVWLARVVNDEYRAIQYEQIAMALRHSIEEAFVNENGEVNFCLECDNKKLDAVNALGLLWVFTPQDISSKETLAAMEKQLAISYGYRRFPPEQRPTENEWVPADLFIANLNQFMTNFNKAEALKSWVSSQAYYNYGLIPEYYTADRADYSGLVPLCGMGAGIYISSFWGD